MKIRRNHKNPSRKAIGTRGAILRAAACLCLLLCLMQGVFSACAPSERISAEELCLAIDALFPFSDRGAWLLSSERRGNSAENAVFEPLTAEEFGHLYTGRYETPHAFSRLLGAAVRLPLDGSGFEIHVTVALNPSDTEALRSLMSERLERMRSNEILSYAPEEYRINQSNAEIYVKGRYVILLATPDNEMAKKTVKGIL